ncbi:uncharacterized protein LOC134196576 [Corticium candelabrum]|uniref:uncharacterized protein LOC134196576 n=1 Tax=Corticium candelabrum TaxID=121492 RepID=UPI002E259A60|nr:uncharacterized protein LOC134196576 [Corticium candelabrum]
MQLKTKTSQLTQSDKPLECHRLDIRERKSDAFACSTVHLQWLTQRWKSELESEKRRRWTVEGKLKDEKRKCHKLTEQLKKLQLQSSEQNLLALSRDAHKKLADANEMKDEMRRIHAELGELKHQNNKLLHYQHQIWSGGSIQSVDRKQSDKTRSLNRKLEHQTKVRVDNQLDTLIDPHWNERFRPQCNYIIEVLKPCKLLTTLFAEKLIDHNEYCKVRQGIATSTDREVSEMLLLEILFTKGPGSFHKFCSVLRQVEGQQQIADMLEADFD